MDKRIKLSVNMARKSKSRFRLGASLWKRKYCISAGINQMSKTHPLQQKYCDEPHTLGLHAEIHCCIGVSAKDMEGAEMVVARILKDGSLAMAKPCKVCTRFLREVGIVRVTYTTGNGCESIDL